MLTVLKRHSLSVALVATCALFSSCSSYRPAPKAFHEATIQPYRVDSGDRLRVTVFDQKDLSNTYSVDQAGYIAFSAGRCRAGSRPHLQELEGQLAAKLQQGFLRNPDISIEVDRYRSIFVMGEVGQPGQYTYVPGMTVQTAIAVAGGYSSRASQANADVTRKINGEIMTGRVLISDPVLAGDTIYVRERLF